MTDTTAQPNEEAANHHTAVIARKPGYDGGTPR